MDLSAVVRPLESPLVFLVPIVGSCLQNREVVEDLRSSPRSSHSYTRELVMMLERFSVGDPKCFIQKFTRKVLVRCGISTIQASGLGNFIKPYHMIWQRISSGFEFWDPRPRVMGLLKLILYLQRRSREPGTIPQKQQCLFNAWVLEEQRRSGVLDHEDCPHASQK